MKKLFVFLFCKARAKVYGFCVNLMFFLAFFNEAGKNIVICKG